MLGTQTTFNLLFKHPRRTRPSTALSAGGCLKKRYHSDNGESEEWGKFWKASFTVAPSSGSSCILKNHNLPPQLEESLEITVTFWGYVAVLQKKYISPIFCLLHKFQFEKRFYSRFLPSSCHSRKINHDKKMHCYSIFRHNFFKIIVNFVYLTKVSSVRARWYLRSIWYPWRYTILHRWTVMYPTETDESYQCLIKLNFNLEKKKTQ